MAIRGYIKDGKKYFIVEVKMRGVGGKQMFRSRQGIVSERKAQEAEFELKKELDSIIEKGPSLFWPEWVKACAEKMKVNFAFSTVYDYEKSLNKWTKNIWEKKSIKEITREDIHQVLYNEATTISDNSRRDLLKKIRRIFQMAVEDGYLDRNPAQGITVRVAEITKSVLTNQEADLFLTKAKEIDHPFYPIWVTALMTGLRSGELKALCWTDIDFEAKTISVTKQWSSKVGFTPTKSRKNRVVPISEDFLAFLKELKIQSQGDVSFVLPQLSEWAHGEQAKVIRAFCAKIGVTPIKFHDLRATFITNLLARGVSLAKVMAIVGHTEIKTTNVYLRLAGVDIKGATDDLGYKIPSFQEAQIYQLRSKK